MQGQESNELIPAARVSNATLEPSASGPSSARGARVMIAGVVVASLLVGGVLAVRVKQAVAKREAFAAERASTQAAAMKKPPAQVTHPTPVQWTPRVELTGTLRPWREADVGFELGGRLVSVNVAVGDRVRDRQTLAVLDASRAMAQVNEAEAQTRATEAQLALAQDNLKRTQALVASNALPEAQAEEARQQVALLKAQLEGAHANVSFMKTGAGQHTLVAPFAGLVTKAPTAAGAVVQPNAPLVRVEDLSKLRLSATVGEEDAPAVKVGAPVDVFYRDRKVNGRVTAVVPSLDQATRRAPIEVVVDNDPKSPILAYGFVRATVRGQGEVAAMRIPPTARRPGSQDEIVKVEEGKAKVIHVAHAVDDDGAWIVARGIAPGDTIVLSPDPDVKDGDPIDVAHADAKADVAAVKAQPAPSAK